MNGIMNEARLLFNGLWYCDMCEKEIIFSKRLRLINSITHIHNEKFGIVVKDYEIIKPEIVEIDYIPDKVIKDCRDKNIHTFEYRCVYYNKFMNTANNEEIILTITNGYKCFKSEDYRLNKQTKNAQKKMK